MAMNPATTAMMPMDVEVTPVAALSTVISRMRVAIVSSVSAMRTERGGVESAMGQQTSRLRAVVVQSGGR